MRFKESDDVRGILRDTLRHAGYVEGERAYHGSRYSYQAETRPGFVIDSRPADYTTQYLYVDHAGKNGAAHVAVYYAAIIGRGIPAKLVPVGRRSRIKILVQLYRHNYHPTHAWLEEQG